ncbi:MBL fold metallo-hydrolase [Alsobacter sp. KACC 23698]|uniref:MBL fold metallo-hydrolase n=1 Tax=Alsobacter sp. KACC 23698 TaxID=3149229 RepID=A0AAU7JKU4_9HYPH
MSDPFTTIEPRPTLRAAEPGPAPASQLHRFRHGEFEIVVLSDGYITLSADVILPDAEPDERPGILARLQGGPQSAPFQVNIPLIRIGEDLILVDTGSGDKFQPSAGRLASHLRAAGVDPASITKVVFTHVHPDHAGGTIKPEGALMCPNARYYVSEAELQFWVDPNYEATMPPTLHAFARGAQRDLAAIEDRLTLLRPGDAVAPGMQAIETPGHTPGHLSYQLDGPDLMIVNGDVATSNVVFFEHPTWRFGFDVDPEIALRTRQHFLDRAATEKIRMLGYHWPYPGLGYAERKGTVFRFVADAGTHS